MRKQGNAKPLMIFDDTRKKMRKYEIKKRSLFLILSTTLESKECGLAIEQYTNSCACFALSSMMEYEKK